MNTKFKRGSMVVAALAASAVALSTGGTAAFAAPPIGTAPFSPTSGNSDTVFTMLPSEFPAASGGAFCSGAGTAGYRWQTYIVDSGVDSSTLTFGSGPAAVPGHYVSRMFDSGGNGVINKNPSPTGQITGIPTFSLSALTTIPPGTYKAGFACTFSGAIENGRYWESTFTIAANSGAAGGSAHFVWGQPGAAHAPTLSSPLTATPGQLAGSFTDDGLSIPAPTGFTVSAVPQGGGTTVTTTVATAGAFTLTGLVNGTTYDVSVVANSTGGNSPASNVVSGTPNLAARQPITGFTATQGANLVHLAWNTPSDGPVTNYTLGVSPALAGAPTTVTGNSVDIANPADGVAYTFTLTANYPSAPLTGPQATTTFTYAGAMIIQDLTVVRPAGALILTQRCGVNGALAAEGATANGYPATGSVAASADQVGTAPTTGANPGGPADGQFVNYPFPTPATYPTHCGVDLGTASFLTSGTLAGQFYAANGQLNQVTVADNRDGTAPWTVSGKVTTPFSIGGTNTFSGNYLGWTPVKTSSTPGQNVTAGPAIQPSATDTYTAGTEGLGNSQTLASAPSGAAQGIATLDARLKLLIPVNRAAGTYTAALTISAI